MKNEYLTKKQKRDMVISVLYDWSLGVKPYPNPLEILTRLSPTFRHSLAGFNVNTLTEMMRDMMHDVQSCNGLIFHNSISPTMIQLYATEHNLHISQMKVVRYEK